MKAQWVKKYLIPAITVLVGGIIFIVICFILYLAIVLLLERTIYKANPQALPMDLVRMGSMLCLVAVYLVMYFTKLPDLLKAVLLPGAIGAIGITIILSLYQKPWLAVCVFLGVVGGIAFLFVRQKKPWYFYLALIFASVIAIAYAWPMA